MNHWRKLCDFVRNSNSLLDKKLVWNYVCGQKFMDDMGCLPILWKSLVFRSLFWHDDKGRFIAGFGSPVWKNLVSSGLISIRGWLKRRWWINIISCTVTVSPRLPCRRQLDKFFPNHRSQNLIIQKCTLCWDRVVEMVLRWRHLNQISLPLILT